MGKYLNKTIDMLFYSNGIKIFILTHLLCRTLNMKHLKYTQYKGSLKKIFKQLSSCGEILSPQYN